MNNTINMFLCEYVIENQLSQTQYIINPNIVIKQKNIIFL